MLKFFCLFCIVGVMVLSGPQGLFAQPEPSSPKEASASPQPCASPTADRLNSPFEELAPPAGEPGIPESSSSPEELTPDSPEDMCFIPEWEEETTGLPRLMELRVHVITTSNIFANLKFDIFDVATRKIAGRGQGSNELLGEAVATFELPAGIYKIVKAGESINTRVDFATLVFEEETDFLIVVDADNGAFRGSGILSDELPKGLKIGGVRFALNLGGSVLVNQKSNVVGGTNGLSAQVGLFGNFGMVYDKGPHFLTLSANAQVSLQNLPTSSIFANSDHLEASVLYAYNINNDYIGPYARAGLRTRLFPGYLYLNAGDSPEGSVTVHEVGVATPTIYRFGGESNPDDLRIEVAKSLSPFILQEELGVNLKAVDWDLKLLELSVATRLGWGLRQGISGGLLVVDGDERGENVVLREVENYATTGPIVGVSSNVTFARWLFGQAEAAAMLPVSDTTRAGSTVTKRILVDASGSAGLKFPALTSLLHASFDYTFRLQRDGYLNRQWMFDHTLMARMNLQLF